eukprot:gnl/TRDRNA2_/TRDRNA2_147330_c0_seq1.p1 gnl/TRDRNA2_/TRDRNA2_147330_c0~~gnl/TRDRNA2_/TRDRNA2_147330_c0_seq1.p1  ORF type:complete len:137 (+),score=9.92 gnl/TRDRNA2_/TRDRNA2_147330_c0_seq1:2-412(+)
MAWGASPSSAAQAEFQQVGQQFAQFYYQTFDSNRQGLSPLYSDTSLLTFEGTQIQGSQSITQKLVSLPFQTVAHQIVRCDCQPVPGLSDRIVLSITGNLVVDGGVATPLKFAQFFQLAKKPDGNWFVLNDIFRINV